MSSGVGRIGEFNPEVEDWTEYVERVHFYFVANDIANAQKRATFLAGIGPTTYKLLRSLIAPAKVEEKTLDQLTEVLQKHYCPKPSAIVQRSRFYSRCRKFGESVTNYLADLCKLAEFCNFGEKLDDMLRDRLICGINDSAMQRKLLAEGDELELEDALKQASSMEVAYKDSKELPEAADDITQSVKSEPVNKVNRSAQPRPTNRPPSQKRSQSTSTYRTESRCYRCLSQGHSPAVCPYRNEQCYACRKVGHTRAACRSNSQPRYSRRPRQYQHRNQQQIHHVETSTAEQEDSRQDDYELQPSSLQLNRIGTVANTTRGNKQQ